LAGDLKQSAWSLDLDKMARTIFLIKALQFESSFNMNFERKLRPNKKAELDFIVCA